MNKIYYVLAFCIVFWACSSDSGVQEQADEPMDDPTDDGDDNPMQTAEFMGEIDSITTFGGSNSDEAKAIAATPDGGAIVVGSTRSIDGDITDKTAPNFDVLVIKLSESGDVEWSKTYGGSNDDVGEDIIVANDGSYVFTGSSLSNDGDVSENSGSFDQWTVKIDLSGNILWEKSYGFSGRDQAFSLSQTSDGGYFVSGVLDVSASDGEGNDGFTAGNRTTSASKSTAVNHAGGEVWITKLDAEGDMQFRRYYGGSTDDRGYGAFETPDGGYIFTASTESSDFDVDNTKGAYDFWVVKVNTNKEIEWERTYGGGQIDMAYSLVPLSDGNYLISGDTRSNDQDVSGNKGNADFWSLKINGSGNIIWDYTYGGSNYDAARGAFEMSDGSLAITGSSRSESGDVSVNRGQNDGYLTILNSSGQLSQAFNIGGSGLDYLYGVTQNKNNALFVVGSTSSTDFDIEENKGDNDVLLIKIN